MLCSLHNICGIFSEEFLDDWISADAQDVDHTSHSTTASSSSGGEIRDALVCYFNH